MPAFFMLEKEVFKPIADKAQTMRNLLARFVAETRAAGIGNKLATMDIARKPRMNQGKILAMLKFALRSLPFWLLEMASFRLMRSWIKAKTTTVGMIASVLVSFTMVAKSPAPSEKA